MLEEYLGVEAFEDHVVRDIPVVTLAYIGDGLFDLFIRTHLVKRHPKMPIHPLNLLKVACVKASKQAEIAMALMPTLTEEELAVLKRGRNAKLNTVPKNAKMSDYRYATGFEALLGYLSLMRRSDRVSEILTFALDMCLED